MAKHPDLLTRIEAAELLGASKSALDHGWGPPRLPQYKRKAMYSRELCERWLAQQKEEAWASTGKKTPDSGGARSPSTAKKSAGQLARKVEERLLARSAKSARPKKERHLVAVEGKGR